MERCFTSLGLAIFKITNINMRHKILQLLFSSRHILVQMQYTAATSYRMQRSFTVDDKCSSGLYREMRNLVICPAENTQLFKIQCNKSQLPNSLSNNRERNIIQTNIKTRDSGTYKNSWHSFYCRCALIKYIESILLSLFV